MYISDHNGSPRQDSNREQVVSYRYNSWGRQLSMTDTTTEKIGEKNPFRYREYCWDEETSLYYVNSRYYDPETGRFISADDVDVLEVEQDSLQQYNLYAYCLNNPVNRLDEDGNFSISVIAKGIGTVATGLAAIGAGIAVMASGVAAPLMLGVAVGTIAAGVLTTANGASDIGEGVTGRNIIRDKVFQGNKKAYNTYSKVTVTVSAVGSAVCGGWMAVNKPRISAYKNIPNYKYTKTISDSTHMKRPYNNSVLIQKQIIKYGKMTKDKQGFGYVFTAKGTFNNKICRWRLGVNVMRKLVWHFGHDF